MGEINGRCSIRELRIEERRPRNLPREPCPLPPPWPSLAHGPGGRKGVRAGGRGEVGEGGGGRAALEVPQREVRVRVPVHERLGEGRGDRMEVGRPQSSHTPRIGTEVVNHGASWATAPSGFDTNDQHTVIVRVPLTLDQGNSWVRKRAQEN